jgi:predicted ribosome quality control (RQC) complex YloA/Tae2 family protein
LIKYIELKEEEMKIKSFNDFERIDESLKLSKVCKREEFEGYEILIGRNADSNDILTTEIAEPEDIWLHASQVPGSHVVIREKGIEVPKEVIQRAAELAAKNSKGQGKVKVVWTKSKYVHKEKGQKPGEVYVDYNKTHLINVMI